MQLFVHITTLLSIDTASFKRRLHVQRYAAIPLAPNAGLIGWVLDSNTLHVLAQASRDSRKILPNIEYWPMLQVSDPKRYVYWLSRLINEYRQMAALSFNEWDNMDDYIAAMKRDPSDCLFSIRSLPGSNSSSEWFVFTWILQLHQYQDHYKNI